MDLKTLLKVYTFPPELPDANLHLQPQTGIETEKCLIQQIFLNCPI